MKDKVIIFGAGNYGKSAYDYYGSERVLFFADNNQEKIGKLYCKKKIEPFERLESVVKENPEVWVVVACTYTKEICIQLENAGIYGYSCFSPSMPHMMLRLKERIQDENFKEIYLCGIGYETNDIYCAIEELGYHGRIQGIITGKYDLPVTLNINKVEKVDKHKEVCIIVSSITNHLAMRAWLKMEYPFANVIDPFKQIAYYDTNDIVINPYENKTEDVSEGEWIKATNGSLNKTEIWEYVKTVKDHVPLFEYVEIETINRCNGSCSFCPVNRKLDPRIETRMERELFNKIINELSALNYSGELSLFSNNEPLLDERIVELHKYAREKLPHTRIHMFTNGTLFTMELFVKLIPYLDELIIDNYQQNLQLIKPVKEIKDYVETHDELRKKVTIVLRKPNEILTSRGGDAPNREEMVSYKEESCALPFEQLIIRPDGKVSLCCNDPLGKNTLGDVAENTLEEVWYNPKFAMVRKCLAEGRGNWKHCEYCDTFYLY